MILDIQLASKSPRRRDLLEKAGFKVKIVSSHVEEVYPETLAVDTVAEYLAELKMQGVENKHKEHVYLTSDTIVALDNEVIGKPVDREDAINTLLKLSGSVHKVISGVCIWYQNRQYLFSDTTYVEFEQLPLQLIKDYVDNDKPFDKAGSYGIQDSIGVIGVRKLIGSYHNVMGLPVNKVVQVMKELN